MKLKKGKPGSLFFFINDPEGNRIELMQIVNDSMQAKAALEFSY
jgi:hypothetical protein